MTAQHHFKRSANKQSEILAVAYRSDRLTLTSDGLATRANLNTRA